MTARASLAGLCAALLAAPAPAGEPARKPTPAEVEFFEKHVRPVLAAHCYECHGPKKQMAGLRLDSAQALRDGGDNGPAVVPGEPEKSRLVQAVRHDGRLKMPPRDRLPAAAVDALTAWVRMGAPWPPESKTVAKEDDAWRRHWAFLPVRDPPIPEVRDRDWPLTSIDHFLLAKLEAKGLKPSPQADRRTLIRRVTFNLTGLPPTPAEVEAFVNDRAPDAWAKVVDRLLASPAYGERWARHWLDVARYADTKGYVFFESAEFPWAWTYRDYVIRSLNEDKPYDRFLLEQLAADRLDLGDDKRPLTALGFLTLGGRFMNNLHDILDDRIDVVTRGLMGLTVSCARCHDHKYDPIPARDYYSLHGVFASSAEPEVPPLFEPLPRTKEYEDFDRELKAREGKLAEFRAGKHAELVRGARTRAAEYLLAAHALRDQPTTEDFMLIADGKDLNPTMIVRWKAYLERTRKAHHPVLALWHALADLPEKDFAARAAAACTKPDPARPLNPLVAKAFADNPPRSLAEVAKRYANLLNEADAAREPSPDQEELRQVFRGPGAPPNLAPTEINDLALLPDRASQGTLQALRRELEKWRVSGPGAPPRAMVLHDLPTPVEPRVFLRGNPNHLGEPVPRQFPAVLAGAKRQSFADGSGRLELAHAIIDRKNPLTARVLVNRVWMHHFGRGLVTTPGDFGMRSDPPSHPELLDHLATRFMDGGWSLKKLHRLILLSRAYQQTSDDRPEGRAVDPENALLWKMNRRRLDFESLRDALLAVSGRLEGKVGGASVKDMLSPEASRRTLYGHLDRLNVPGLYRTFDFPSPDATSPQRDETTVAPQALFLMNHPFILEVSKRIGTRADVSPEALYLLLYARPPMPRELAAARAFLGDAPDRPTLERYVHALLMANEFSCVD